MKYNEHESMIRMNTLGNRRVVKSRRPARLLNHSTVRYFLLGEAFGMTRSIQVLEDCCDSALKALTLLRNLLTVTYPYCPLVAAYLRKAAFPISPANACRCQRKSSTNSKTKRVGCEEFALTAG